MKGVKEMVNYKQERSASLGDILVIYRDDYPIGNISFLGKTHPDAILRAWGKPNIAFPMTSIGDITQADIERIAEKYLQ